MPKILVADDSIAVRKVAERLLTEAGLGVTLAANGEEALVCLAKERPDVVVSDVIMPDKSGYEVCEYIRGNAMLASTPVLLISGIVNDEVTRQAESCHADGVLKKPFQGSSLKDRVLELLAKRQEAGSIGVAAPEMKPPNIIVDRISQRAEEQLDKNRQSIESLTEIEAQLQTERSRSEEIEKKLTTHIIEPTRVQELESLLETERRRSADLASQLQEKEERLARLEGLERVLKEEQDRTANAIREVQELQNSSRKVAELDAMLKAERESAGQLLQRINGLEKASAEAREAEKQSVREEHWAAELEQKAKDAEAAVAVERARVGELSSKLEEAERDRQRATELEGQLVAEQQKGAEIAGRVNELERTVSKLKDIEVQLATEQDRNKLLARRVSETEQAAENATRRYEEMMRKLGEIVGFTWQAEKVKGRS